MATRIPFGDHWGNFYFSNIFLSLPSLAENPVLKIASLLLSPFCRHPVAVDLVGGEGGHGLDLGALVSDLELA